MNRHLIYHVYPSQKNDGWKRNLDQLLRPERMKQFNGLKVLAIATDVGCEEDQLKVFEAVGSNFNVVLTLANDPLLREVVTFEPLLNAVSKVPPDDAIFYAHTKGNTTVDGELGATRWRNAMYSQLLDTDAWKLLCEHHRFVGCCKIEWHPHWRRLPGMIWRTPFPSKLEPRHRWMLAGTFYWFSAKVFQRNDWRALASVADRYTAEAWPGQMYPSHCGLSVFQPRPSYEPWNPYDPNHYGEEYDDYAVATPK